MRETPVLVNREIDMIEFKDGSCLAVGSYAPGGSKITNISIDQSIDGGWCAFSGDRLSVTVFKEPAIIHYK